MDCSRDLLHYKSYLWIFPSRKIEIISPSSASPCGHAHRFRATLRQHLAPSCRVTVMPRPCHVTSLPRRAEQQPRRSATQHHRARHLAHDVAPLPQAAVGISPYLRHPRHGDVPIFQPRSVTDTSCAFLYDARPRAASTSPTTATSFCRASSSHPSASRPSSNHDAPRHAVITQWQATTAPRSASSSSRCDQATCHRALERRCHAQFPTMTVNSIRREPPAMFS
jgi:hypothetical protein